MAYCAFCDIQFESSSAKHIYHNEECRVQASRLKTLERQRIKKIEKRQHKERRCAGGCGTILSIYNDMPMCTQCLANDKRLKKFMAEIKELIDYKAHP